MCFHHVIFHFCKWCAVRGARCPILLRDLGLSLGRRVICPKLADRLCLILSFRS